MARATIDLNADLGEERGDDAAIFPCLSSANIACGAHAGGSRIMDSALAAASRHGVTVGAHVGYDDRANFGRVPLDVPAEELRASLTQQIAKLQHLASRFGISVRYVKPHGALYHRVGTDAAQAQALVDAVMACDASMNLLVPFSPMLRKIAKGIDCRHEFFADRGYRLDGHLVDRSHPDALLHDVDAIVERTVHWVRTGEVRSVEGKAMRIEADSICLHGDSPRSVEVAKALRDALLADGVTVTHWNSR